MKPKTTHEPKMEPKSRGVNPTAVADLGVHHIHTRSEPMYQGRGIEAPMHSMATHKSGSQGKH